MSKRVSDKDGLPEDKHRVIKLSEGKYLILFKMKVLKQSRKCRTIRLHYPPKGEKE